MNLSEAIRGLREATGLTQSGLARRTGLSEAMLAHFETGSRVPDPLRLAKLCRLALNAERLDLADVFASRLPGAVEGLVIPAWHERARVTPKNSGLETAPAEEQTFLTSASSNLPLRRRRSASASPKKKTLSAPAESRCQPLCQTKTA